MSEQKFEPVKNFLSITRGNTLPEGVVVITKGDCPLQATHANIQQAKLDLEFLAKQTGANALLEVFVEYRQYYGTLYTAYGIPAVVARTYGHCTHTAAQLASPFHMPPRPVQIVRERPDFPCTTNEWLFSPKYNVGVRIELTIFAVLIALFIYVS